MVNFAQVKSITIPEGVVTKITAGGVVLWQKPESAAPGGNLPTGYTQLAYIQSTGTQYIDTGYDPVKEMVLEIGYEYTSTSSSTYYYVFGNYNSAGKATWRLMTNKSECVLNTHTSCDRANFSTEAKQVNVRYDDVIANDSYTTNGTAHTITNLTQGSSNTRNLALFANYVGGRKTSMKLYYCRIREGDTPIRDFIPCLDADGVPCLFDTVSQQPYYNDGTGEFAYE